jgi:hypothetical protein
MSLHPSAVQLRACVCSMVGNNADDLQRMIGSARMTGRLNREEQHI